ncbi:uncharacterized protein LOC128194097 isoform X2 [Vigna angularis]|uniref:uncharacterized protein LOC128194097 isoform X2 n=1 Tax=Phaseolus angularis TaxID=3914 RepID=UPI0022B35C14|nr:uncharacterized protein LOC128194097 isoform X2 [Vigna angularis]
MGKGKHYGKSCVSLDSALPQECTPVLINPDQRNRPSRLKHHKWHYDSEHEFPDPWQLSSRLNPLSRNDRESGRLPGFI